MTGNLAKSEAAVVPPIPMKTIDGPAAWRGLELKNPSDFTHQLTDVEVAEIDAAVRAIIDGHIDHSAIDRRNFELPHLGERLTRIRDNVLLQGRGFIVIRGVPVGRYSMQEAAAASLGMGVYIGKPVS